MKILDEDLIYNITYKSDCKGTFEKYRKTLYRNILLVSLGVLIVIFIFIISFYTNKNLQGDDSTNEIIFHCFISLIWFSLAIYLLYGSIKDLRAKRLNVESDFFLKITSEIIDKKKKYWLNFEEADKIEISYKNKQKFDLKPRTKVYIIRAGYSNFLLDILPIEKVHDSFDK